MATKDTEEGNYESDANDDRDDEDDYYGEEDLDIKEEKAYYEERQAEENLTANFNCGHGSELATRRLVKDLKAFEKSETKFGIEASPSENNLFVWSVKFTQISPDTILGKDLVLYAKNYKQEPVIHLEMKFPSDYPFSPPFIQVLRPRFKYLTGHVTQGGSICMQMLTKSGWRPTNDVESVLIQVRAQILSDPNSRLAERETNTPYSQAEARKAFHRMVHKYGW